MQQTTIKTIFTKLGWDYFRIIIKEIFIQCHLVKILRSNGTSFEKHLEATLVFKCFFRVPGMALI